MISAGGSDRQSATPVTYASGIPGGPSPSAGATTVDGGEQWVYGAATSTTITNGGALPAILYGSASGTTRSRPYGVPGGFFRQCVASGTTIYANGIQDVDSRWGGERYLTVDTAAANSTL